MLEIAGLTVRYPGLAAPVLDVPELRVAEGERLAVTGPSGSGKTTFVNAVAGLDRFPGARIAWRGMDVAALPEGRRDRWRAANVGLVMQDFHLFPGLGALDNVLLPARLESSRLARELQARALDLLGRVGLARPDQKVGTLSRGEMQRVALARAVLRRPPLLVADEPTASLDEAAGRQAADLLLELAAETGATVVVVSHDAALVARMPRRLVLKAGHIVEDVAS